MFERWFANDAAALREWLIARTPELLHGLIATGPLWALAALAFVVALAAVWAVVQLFEAAWKGAKALLNPAETARNTFNPEPAAKKKDVEGLERQVAAQSEVLASMKAQLDRLAAQNVATGAAPLDDAARQRRDTAAADIVAEATPAANEAARELAAGDLAGAIATLERDARADAAAAAEKWRRIGALVLGVDTAKARNAYEEAFKLQPGDFWTCVELARLRRESGDLDGSRTAALAAERAARDDRERSVAANELGDVLLEGGDLAGAKARYEEGLRVSERLARDNPGSAEAQRDLSISYNNLGDVLLEGGDLAGAKARYEEGLRVSERLARDNPGSAEAQRDLAISYERLGEVAKEIGDLMAAKEWFEKELLISQARMEKDVGSAEAKRFHSVVLNKLGDVLREGGDLAGAKARYEEDLRVSERLARDNPGSAEAQRDLYISYDRLGEVARLSGDKASALQHYRTARTILGDLLARDATTVALKVDRIELDFRLAQINGDDATFASLHSELAELKARGLQFGRQGWMAELEAAAAG